MLSNLDNVSVGKAFPLPSFNCEEFNLPVIMALALANPSTLAVWFFPIKYISCNLLFTRKLPLRL